MLIDGALFLNHMLVRFGSEAVDADDFDLIFPLSSVESKREYACDESSECDENDNLIKVKVQIDV